MYRQILPAAAVGVLVLGLAPQAGAATGPMSFEPIAGSAYDQVTADWTEPFVVPTNCTQTMISDETVLDTTLAGLTTSPT